MRELPILDPRIPPWDKTDLTERNCPVCGSAPAPARFRRPDGLDVYCCASCATHVVSPAPSEAALASLYASYDSKHSRNELSLEELRRLLDGSSPFEDMRIRELATQLPLKRSKVLDVGFGRAGLLYQLKRLGADVYGVDLDESAHEFARGLGIEDTVHGDVHDLDPTLHFDAVLLNDVIEHPLLPLPLLRDCAARLAAGGILLLWTPNGGTIESADDPVVLRVDLEHMQYLGTESCIRIAELLGLRLIHLETVGIADPSEYRNAKQGAFPEAVSRRSFRHTGKRWLRAVPGFSLANRIRKAFATSRSGDEFTQPGMEQRCGDFHLLAMFQKP